MEKMNNKKGNVLVSFRFPDTSDVIADIENEFTIQNEIAKLMHKLVSDGVISHFTVADDDIISEKLKKN